jgi:sialic acid synthase SpsE
MKPDTTLVIDQQRIGTAEPTYFIADIAANHDGNLERAIELINLAKQAGADAAKFQHFRAETIVSDVGFRELQGSQSHQSTWKRSVYDVYKAATVTTDWTPMLKKACENANIAFFTSPYDKNLVDHIDPFVQAYKIGSGDITWHNIIEHIARKQKPIMLATGASTMDEVVRAVELALSINPRLALLQCNTNYTGSLDNFRYIQLNVLKCYREMFPDLVLGLSDHTPGHATVLGAVTLGARIIEKHFTDDTSRDGPDHAFSMTPHDWREMVDRTRELELALGNGIKRVERNEEHTVVLQRRALRMTNNLPLGHILTEKDIVALRPCPPTAFQPHQMQTVLGARLRVPKLAGSHLQASDLLLS